jgi:cell division protein FtsW
MRVASTVLMFCVAGLLALGMAALYSASMAKMGSQLVIQQLVWCGLGLAAAAGCAVMDYHRWRQAAWVLVLVAVVGLALVFVPGLGRVINGARRWIHVGPVNIQPSELAKLAGIIALAAYCEYQQRRMGRLKEGLVVPGLCIALVAGLILAGRDYGTTLLFCAVTGLMLVVSGVRWRFLLPVALAGLTIFAVAIWSNPVRQTRVKAWFNPEQYEKGKGYQPHQAKLAFGTGGVEGRGMGNGRQKTFVPEVHTDFILAAIGEELGLVGSLSVVLGFVALVVCGLAIAERARDPFGTYLAFGITMLIGLQAFVNVGVVTSLLPNKGLPLPFISYGGSNLLMLLAAVGILLSVARQGLAPERVPADPFAAAGLAQKDLS